MYLLPVALYCIIFCTTLYFSGDIMTLIEYKTRISMQISEKYLTVSSTPKLRGANIQLTQCLQA